MLSNRLIRSRILSLSFFATIAALVFVLQAFFLTPVAPAQQESPAAARVRGLNNHLLRIHGQMQRAAPHEEGLLRSQAATAIAERAAALSDLIENNPHDALSFAFSAELLADLATKFPQSAALLESHTTVSGPVQHWIADYPDKTSRSWWQMDAGGRSLNLYFAGLGPGSLKSDEVLEATGVVAGSNMAVEKSVVRSGAAASVSTKSPLASSQSPPVNRRPATGSWQLLLLCGLVFGVGGKIRLSRERMLSLLKHFAIYGLVFPLIVFTSMPSYAQSSCSTTGVQHIAVIIVNFGGYTFSVSPTDLQNAFSGSGHSLTGYWQETSYGQTSATADLFGPYTLPGTYSCTVGNLIDDAIAAAITDGLNTSNYTRYFIFAPQGPFSSCGWVDGATVGCYSYTASTGSYTASRTLLTDYHFDSPDHIVWYLVHEGGHNLGLMHSGTIQNWSGSTPTALGPLSSPGAINEWNDLFSAMGGSFDLGEYNAEHRADIGWLTTPTNYQPVSTSGTYTLQPLETSPPGLKALRVQRGTGNSGYYLWIEYRQPIGYDTWESGYMNYNGALIHYQDPTSDTVSPTGTGTKVVEFTQSDVGVWYNTVLGPGQTWTDPYSNVSISVLGATSSGLTVAVNYGATPCTAAAPNVSLSPLNPSVYPGQSAGYTVSITNHDSSGCSSSTINLGSTEPSGWSTSLSASSVTLSPGQSTSVTMGKGAPAGTPAGTYAVNLNAATTSSTGSGTANATVMTPPSLAISVSISGASFTKPGTVPITATVTNGGTPASGANVTFTLTTPSGVTSTQTATTGSSGTATWNYKLNAKSPTGTYSVVAQAALSSGTKKNAATTQTATSNTGTFSVQ